MASTTRPLASALLSNINFNKSDRKTLSLEFKTSAPVVFFQDRPGFNATKLDWGELSTDEYWGKLFGKKATFHSLIDSNDDLYEFTIKKPKQLSEDVYSAKIKLNQSNLPSKLDDVKEISLFTDLNQNRSKAKYASSESIPSGSDFMGHVREIELSVNPKNKKIRLRGKTPFQLSHFSSNTATKDMPGSITLNDFSSPEQWEKLFGNDNPNSALAWTNKGQDFVLSFKQSRPAIRNNGSWILRGQPLLEADQNSDQFFKAMKTSKTLSLQDATLMIDSSGNDVSGSVNWDDVSKAIGSLNTWFEQNPNVLCDSVSAAGALIGGLEGAVAGAIGGGVLGGGGGALTGLGILSLVGTVADVTGAPEVIGIAAGAVGGAAVGGATGSAAISAGMAVFDTGISGTICDFVTGENAADDGIDKLIQNTENLFTFGNTITDDVSKEVETVTNTITNTFDTIKGWF